jgi:predicted 3-demethylubiquinone-9 3-methyltransferase (glyoxalase superfamily)
VNGETQAEVDKYWEQLSAGGQKTQCGWLKDKFGLSWQVVPNLLIEMVQDKNPARVKRVIKAMMPMKKLDIAVLEKHIGRNEPLGPGPAC